MGEGGTRRLEIVKYVCVSGGKEQKVREGCKEGKALPSPGSNLSYRRPWWKVRIKCGSGCSYVMRVRVEVEVWITVTISLHSARLQLKFGISFG